ncbi:uncharacterized protein LOC131147159 [Malania oleifera]|uniref:uncharacterized protein LOC131147159 n=1 Tax=Malania oleifera TaxID=397392 RepID=UPI0025AE6E37|nr:uncharacterized protein LOC131147159 [Malania oleifera]
MVLSLPPRTHRRSYSLPVTQDELQSVITTYWDEIESGPELGPGSPSTHSLNIEIQEIGDSPPTRTSETEIQEVGDSPPTRTSETEIPDSPPTHTLNKEVTLLFSLQ